MKRHLHVGGVVAMGFDPNGNFLLVISHNGRGVFSTRTWERVARDTRLAYPENGIGIGIGPIVDQQIPMNELDFTTEELRLQSQDGRIQLFYAEGTIEVIDANEPTNED